MAGERRAGPLGVWRGRAGGIGGPAQEETMEAVVLRQEICGKNNWMWRGSGIQARVNIKG